MVRTAVTNAEKPVVSTRLKLVSSAAGAVNTTPVTGRVVRDARMSTAIETAGETIFALAVAG